MPLASLWFEENLDGEDGIAVTVTDYVDKKGWVEKVEWSAERVCVISKTWANQRDTRDIILSRLSIILLSSVSSFLLTLIFTVLLEIL